MVMHYLGAISMQNKIYRPQFQYVSCCISVVSVRDILDLRSLIFPDVLSRPIT